MLDRSENTLFEPAFVEIRAAHTDARSQIIMFVNWVARAGSENKELMLLPVLASLEFFGFGNQAERRVQQMYEHLHQELERIVLEGQSAGMFDADLNAKTVSVTLVAFIDGLLLQWYRWGEGIDGPALARQARLLILGGLKSNSGKPG